MKAVLATIIFQLLLSTYCEAQSLKNTTIGFELGKTGLIYNLSFDHRISGKSFGVRAIAGSNFGRNIQLQTLGAGFYSLYGRQRKFFELGIDINYLKVDETSDDQRGFADITTYPNYSIKTIYTSMNIGYRILASQTVFRVGISPGFTKEEFMPGAYISLGVRI